MESINAALNRVQTCKTNLSAEVVLREEVGHTEHLTETVTYEYENDGHHGESLSYPIPTVTETREVVVGERWVVDVPRETRPDNEKREDARKELEEIYAASRWYSARYAAELALHAPAETLKRDLRAWSLALSAELRATRQETRRIKEAQSVFMFVDQQTRLKAVEDTAKLYGLSQDRTLRDALISVYRGCRNDILAGAYEEADSHGRPIARGYVTQLRRAAGGELGYLRLRIFFRNLPAWVHDCFLSVVRG